MWTSTADFTEKISCTLWRISPWWDSARNPDAMDCGPTSQRIVARFYGKSYSLQNLRERCHISREGVSLLGYLRPYRAYIAQILLAMLVASVISLILPFITQSVVDTGIGTGNMSFIVMLLVAQLVLVMGQMCNNLIRSWLMLHMSWDRCATTSSAAGSCST